MREGVSTIRQGWSYFLRVWNLVGVVTLLLAACVSALHFSRSALASHLWASLLHQRESFINFFPLGQQSQVLIQLNAVLLFLLVLKVRTQILHCMLISTTYRYHQSGTTLNSICPIFYRWLISYDF